MNRRNSIKVLAAGGLVAGVGSYRWLTKSREHPALAVDVALTQLKAIDLAQIQTTGAWEASRTFEHLAQSIEFSMAGFPEMKSELFRKTAGQLAFSVFQARGRMSHGLDAEIPGEVVAPSFPDPELSRARLIASLEQFDGFDGALKPHFAYGELSKSDYAVAHVMHINNHMEEFSLS